MNRHPLAAIADQFQRLADRYERAAGLSVKPKHLLQCILDYEIQAGRLLIDAIDRGAFPQSRTEINGDWWDRDLARVPGGSLVIYLNEEVPIGLFLEGAIPWGDSTLTLELPSEEAREAAVDKLKADALRPFRPEQFSHTWKHALKGWLIPRFPPRFRHRASELDSVQLIKDSLGRFLGRDGKPLRMRTYCDGQLVREGVDWRKGKTQARIVSKLVSEPATNIDKFDDNDWMDHRRAQAETHGDACRLLSELIEGSIADQGTGKTNSTGKPAGRHKKGPPTPARSPKTPSRVVTRGYAARRWFNVSTPTLNGMIRNGAVGAVLMSETQWQFDRHEVKAVTPEAWNDTDPANAPPKRVRRVAKKK